jgi:hypothetical protein
MNRNLTAIAYRYRWRRTLAIIAAIGHRCDTDFGSRQSLHGVLPDACSGPAVRRAAFSSLDKGPGAAVFNFALGPAIVVAIGVGFVIEGCGRRGWE